MTNLDITIRHQQTTKLTTSTYKQQPGIVMSSAMVHRVTVEGLLYRVPSVRRRQLPINSFRHVCCRMHHLATKCSKNEPPKLTESVENGYTSRKHERQIVLPVAQCVN